MTDKNRSIKLIATSVFSFALVILFALGAESIGGGNDGDENSSWEPSNLDVFANVSFMDLNQTETEISLDDTSKNEESAESEAVSLESSAIESQESMAYSSEEYLPEISEEVSEESADGVSSENGSSDDDSSNNSEINAEYPSDLTLLDNGGESFVYFKQDDPEYENLPYGTDKVGSHGCGPVNMAMVISTYTGKVIYPGEAAKWSYENGYWAKGTGTSHSLMTAMAKAYGVPVETAAHGSWTEVINALKQGKYVITRVKNGIFASNNHFLTLRGITEDGKILVANSISYEDSVKEWELSTLKGQVNLGFWIYG